MTTPHGLREKDNAVEELDAKSAKDPVCKR
jgi:hypothetical protein